MREPLSTLESTDTNEINSRDWKNERKFNLNDNKDLNKDKNELYKMCFNNNENFQQVFYSNLEGSKGNSETLEIHEDKSNDLDKIKGKELLALLPTVKISIDSAHNGTGNSYAILDTGAQVNLITDSLV